MLPLASTTTFDKTTNNFHFTKNLMKINPNFNLDILKINENDIIGNSLQDFVMLLQLGKGSNGTIYKVRSKLNNKEYVLKKVNLKNLNIAQQKEAFKEAKILKKVKHPNIIRYYQSFRDEGSLYIIMEYAEGGDLQKLIRTYQDKKKYFTEQEIWRFATEISNAILYLHNRKIIHRDIKTLNVFLSRDHKIKLGDLGFSKIVSNLDALQANRVGTPMYLAPEMIKLKPYDFKVDVWGLGCVLYHISAFEPPFSGENLLLLGYNIINKIPKDLPSIYSEKLNKFVMWLLAKNPFNRPKISDVVDAIDLQNKQNNENITYNNHKDSNNNFNNPLKNLRASYKEEKYFPIKSQPKLPSNPIKEESANDFKKFYDINKKVLENQLQELTDQNRQLEIKKLFEPSKEFLNNYNPTVNKLRTQTSQAQFRYKEKTKEEIPEENPKVTKIFPFESEISSIQKNNDTISFEKETLPKEKEDNYFAFNGVLIEGEKIKVEEIVQKKEEYFQRTAKIESKTMAPIQNPNPKLKEFHKTKSITNLFEQRDVVLFQKFRKNRLLKKEYSGKTINNNVPIFQESIRDYCQKMEIIHAKQKEEDFLLADSNEKDQRAATALEGKREFIKMGFNEKVKIEEKRNDFYKAFFPDSTMTKFPVFNEKRPNTTGAENHLRKKLTIKDLE